MEKHLSFFTNEMKSEEVYKLMVSSIIPRPIAWVSTRNKKDEVNLAPFSFFTVASRNPPTLAFSIGPDEREELNGKKDTLMNIEDTKEYIIHIPNQSLASKVFDTSMPFSSEVDEIQKLDLNTIKGTNVNVPMILDAPVSFELKLKKIIEIGSDYLVLGEVQVVHIRDNLYLGNHKVNSEKLDPLSSVINQFAGMTNLYMPKSNLMNNDKV